MFILTLQRFMVRMKSLASKMLEEIESKCWDVEKLQQLWLGAT
jgi:hypothetical protein